MKAIKVLAMGLLAIGSVTAANAQTTHKHVVTIQKHARHRIVLQHKPIIMAHHKP